MTNKNVFNIGHAKAVTKPDDDSKFSAVVKSIKVNEVILFSSVDILDELKAIFGGDIRKNASGEVWVENLTAGDSSNTGRLFNYMYSGRQFSRIEDVLVIALDMALEQIMHLRNNGIIDES